MNSVYLASAIKQFEYYKLLCEKTFAQLTDEQLLWQYNEESNSIDTIVNHLSGNMLSRWTNFLSTDGEKQWRNREEEFEQKMESRDTLLKRWDAGWSCLFETLNILQEKDLETIIYIRNQGQTVTDAINRQLAHYAYHAGQIVFIGKMICNTNWKSLSIPKGGSDTYNANKFEQPKHIEHFTDESLRDQKKKE